MSSPRAPTFREYIDILKSHYDVAEINEPVSCKYGVEPIIKRLHIEHHPVPFISSVLSHGGVTQVVGCCGSKRALGDGSEFGRLAILLGLAEQAALDEIVEFLIECGTTLPVPVETTNCVIKDEPLTADVWPTELMKARPNHDIHSYGIVVTEDPITKRQHWSVGRTIEGPTGPQGVVLSPRDLREVDHMNDSHVQVSHVKHMPIAMAIGVPPGAIMAGILPVPRGFTRAEFIGAVMREPVKVARSPYTGLEVPVECEAVIEGHVRVEEKAEKGISVDFSRIGFMKEESILPVCEQTEFVDDMDIVVRNYLSRECMRIIKDNDMDGEFIEDIEVRREAGHILAEIKTKNGKVRDWGEIIDALTLGGTIEQVIFVPE